MGIGFIDVRQLCRNLWSIGRRALRDGATAISGALPGSHGSSNSPDVRPKVFERGVLGMEHVQEKNTQRLLLVEDEAIIALGEKKMLERSGYQVTVAGSGQRAVEICRDSGGKIDLVLMDIDLGDGLDGTEAAQEILKSYDLPLIFLSSHTEPEVVEKTEGITSYGYVTKSAGITVLLASIGMAFKLYEAKQVIWEKSMELEAAYEEMSATNEELTSLNDELFNREKALQLSEERYRTLFDNMRDGFAYHRLVLDESGRPQDYLFIKVNPAFAKLSGLENVEGRRISEIVPGINASDPELLARYARVALGGAPESFEIFVEALQEWFAVNVYSPEPGYFVTVFSRTSQQHTLDEASADRQHFIDRILETTPNLIYIYDIKEGKNTYCNKEILSFLGHTAEEIRTMGTELFAKVLHPDDMELVRAHHQRMAVAADQAVLVCEYRMRHASGDWRLLRSSDTVFRRDEDGSVREILGTTSDISAQREHEAMLQRQAKENETLLYELRHRIKNNLNLIINLIDLGMDKIPDPGHRQTCRDAQARIQSMSKIYESLYNSGDLDTIDLGAYVEDFSQRLLEIYQLQEGAVRLQLEVMKLPYSSKKAVPLGLALNEAIVNAVKYAFAPGAEGVITVKLQRENGSAILQISDSGVGLSAGYLPEGSPGVGHALIANLLEQIGGQASIGNGPGGGAEITLRFPVD